MSLANAAGRLPLLPHGEVLALARRVQEWLHHPRPCPPPIQRRGLRARDKLVSHNLRLVITISHKWERALVGHDGATMDDLQQAGAVGLMRAVEKYDPAKGYKFSTYAYWWVESFIRICISDTRHVIKIPNHIQLKMRGFGGDDIGPHLVAAARQAERTCRLDVQLPDLDASLAETIAAPEPVSQLEAIAAADAWEAAQEADPDALALLQLRVEGANLSDLAALVDVSRKELPAVLLAARDAVRGLPEVVAVLGPPPAVPPPVGGKHGPRRRVAVAA
jgi:RNA polymerase sigma factor (sigma-70 family)